MRTSQAQRSARAGEVDRGDGTLSFFLFCVFGQD